MKKSIIIVSHNMKLGGIEKSLLGLLMSFDYNRYDVDLFLFEHEGELMEFIPKQVTLLPEKKYYSSITHKMSESLRNGCFGVAISKLFARFKTCCFNRKYGSAENDVAINYLYKYANFFAPRISKKEYDVAISFPDVHYAAYNKVHAKKRLCWIHTDYSFVVQDKRICKKMWGGYDRIIAVSNGCREAFLKLYPMFSEKVSVIENILPREYVVSESQKETVRFEKGRTNLLTIGRFSYPKNFDSIPNICRAIRDSGIDIKWYLIGFGSEEQLIYQRIKEAGMQDYVVMLGKKENPYPYIKSCDIYVQPSRYEGKCVAVREAQMLGKPVVITRFSTSGSQLEDGVDGVIVPMDVEGCAEGIAAVIRDEALRERLIANEAQRDYTNASEILKLYKMMG